MKKIQNFTDLNAWKEAHKLVLLVYKITETFPKTEQFGLVNQLRRASVSITSNIAEGFGRNSRKDKTRFYTHSKTSLAEVQNQLITARDLGFIKTASFSDLIKQSIIADKLIAGIIKSSFDKRDL